MQKILLLIVAISAMMFSCTNDTDLPSKENTKKGIRFSSSTIANKLKSTGSWKAGDEIYVYMKSAKTTIEDHTKKFIYNQVPATYITINGDGMFTPKTQQDELFFPENGDAVHFTAYAPYAPFLDESEPLTVPLSIPDTLGKPIPGCLDISQFFQEDQTKIDIITAKDLNDRTKEGDNLIQLEFEHIMSKLEFNISTEGALTNNDLVGLKVYIHKLNSSGRYALGAKSYDWVAMSRRPTADPATYFKVSTDGKFAEATLLPEGSTTSSPSIRKLKAIFSLTNGEEYEWEFDTKILLNGVKNRYNIILRKKNNIKVALQLGQSTLTDWANNPIEDVILEQ